MQTWQKFGHKLDSNYWQANKVFWQTIRRPRSKISNIARSIKRQKWWLSYSVKKSDDTGHQN